MHNPFKPRQCEHCLRGDLGSKDAGRAIIKVDVVNPYNHAEVLAIVVLNVCCPTVKYRPRCNILVKTYGHTARCGVCYASNPPGSELFSKPDHGKWSR